MKIQICLTLGLCVVSAAALGRASCRSTGESLTAGSSAGPTPPASPVGSFRAHSGSVDGLAYSPASELLATAGEDGLVKFWDTRQYHLVRSLRVRTRCVAFSPDGAYLATASDGTNAPTTNPSTWLARIWSVRTGRLVRTLRGHRGPVESIAWSADGKSLVTASIDGSAKLWQTKSWVSTATLRESFPSVQKEDVVTANQALFSPDGRTLAVVSVAEYEGEPGSATTRLVLWDVGTRKRGRVLMNESQCWNAVAAFTSDSKRVVAATTGMVSDGDIDLWELPAGKQRALVRGGEASYAAALAPPGRWLVAGGKEWNAFLLDVRSGETVAVLRHPTEVMSMAAAPNGRIVATGDYHGEVRLWRIPPP